MHKGCPECDVVRKPPWGGSEDEGKGIKEGGCGSVGGGWVERGGEASGGVRRRGCVGRVGEKG